MPPARDLNDVQRLTTEYQRLTMSALQEPAKYADALLLISSVHVSLRDGPALSAIDDALGKIEKYTSKHERDDPPLPKDIVRYVALCKTWLEDAKMGPPPDLLSLRERIHHEVMHPMQRYLLQQIEQMQQVSNNIDVMSRAMQLRIAGVAGAVASASPEKP
jgi:hypothetical protein